MLFQTNQEVKPAEDEDSDIEIVLSSDDPEGDDLTFNVLSSNPDVVTVSLSDSSLVVLTLGTIKGSSTITLTNFPLKILGSNK